MMWAMTTASVEAFVVSCGHARLVGERPPGSDPLVMLLHAGIEEELSPELELTVEAADTTCRDVVAAINKTVRSLLLDTPCQLQEGTDLRWVLLRLLNETSRHVGYADATSELFDGTAGE